MKFIGFESSDDVLLQCDVSPDVPWLTVSVAGTDCAESGLAFFAFPERLPLGVHSAKVIFATSNKIRPLGQVLVTARGARGLSVQPAQVFLAQDESAEAKLINSEGAPVAVKEVVVESDSVIALTTEDGRAVFNCFAPIAASQSFEALLRTQDGAEVTMPLTLVKRLK
jgi:hypothetical protein